MNRNVPEFCQLKLRTAVSIRLYLLRMIDSEISIIATLLIYDESLELIKQQLILFNAIAYTMTSFSELSIYWTQKRDQSR